MAWYFVKAAEKDEVAEGIDDYYAYIESNLNEVTKVVKANVAL